MKTLTTDGVNFEISRQLINVALMHVKNNYEADKSHPVEKYYCRAIIEHHSLDVQKKICTISLLDTETGLIFYSKENFELSFLPPELISRAKKVPLINVLVCLKLFYYSVLETIEMTLVIPIGEDIGYFDDTEVITEQCKKILLDFYQNRKDAWMNNLPLPSYKSILQLEEDARLQMSA
jgi:hypothetical protein